MIRLGHSLRLTDRQRSRSGWTDPLAGKSVHFRVQTHRGDNDPTGLLFQDETCTVQASADGHVVMGARHPVTGDITATWSNSMQCPVLRFLNGVPVLDFSGLNTLLKATTSPEGATVYITGVMLRNAVFDGFEGVIGSDLNEAPDASVGRILVGFAGATTWYNVNSRTIRRNGVISNDAAPMQAWAVYSSEGPESVWGTNNLCMGTEADGTVSTKAYYTSLFAITDPDDRAAVEAYAATLNPA